MNRPTEPAEDRERRRLDCDHVECGDRRVAEPDVFYVDVAKVRAARDELGGELVTVLLALCNEAWTAITGDHRVLAEALGYAPRALAARLVRLDEAEAITWVRPSADDEGSITVRRHLGVFGWGDALPPEVEATEAER